MTYEDIAILAEMSRKTLVPTMSSDTQGKQTLPDHTLCYVVNNQRHI